MSLVHKDIDSIIAKHLVVTGKPAYGRIINFIMIMFKKYPRFVKECHKRYMKLLCLYNKLLTPIGITTRSLYKINDNSFWRDIIRNSNQEIILSSMGVKKAVLEKSYIC